MQAELAPGATSGKNACGATFAVRTGGSGARRGRQAAQIYEGKFVYIPHRSMKSRIFFWSITSALAGFLFGFDTVVISGAEQKIQ